MGSPHVGQPQLALGRSTFLLLTWVWCISPAPDHLTDTQLPSNPIAQGRFTCIEL